MLSILPENRYLLLLSNVVIYPLSTDTSAVEKFVNKFKNIS